MAIAAWKDEIPPPRKHAAGTVLERPAGVVGAGGRQDVPGPPSGLDGLLLGGAWSTNWRRHQHRRQPAACCRAGATRCWRGLTPPVGRESPMAGTGRVYTSEELKKALGLSHAPERPGAGIPATPNQPAPVPARLLGAASTIPSIPTRSAAFPPRGARRDDHRFEGMIVRDWQHPDGDVEIIYVSLPE